MVGLNADGELVKLTNRCVCGRGMPLPKMAGKPCPECGQIAQGVNPKPGSPLEAALTGGVPATTPDDSRVSF